MIQNDPESIFILFLKLLGNRLNRPGESWRIPTMANVGTTAGPLNYHSQMDIRTTGVPTVSLVLMLNSGAAMS